MSRPTRRALRLGCAGVLSASVSLAQDTVPSPGLTAEPVKREGVLLGYAVGMGSVFSDPCSDCWSSPTSILNLSHALHLGWTLNRQFALMLEAGGLGTDSADHAFVVGAAQWWRSPVGRFWVKGGLGVGSYVLGDVSEAGGAPTYATVLGECGVEVVRRGNVALDLQGRIVTTKRPESWGSSGSLSVGINWY